MLDREADPSKMIDGLFAREIIDQQDMDAITALQTQKGRLPAARLLFRSVMSKASAGQSMLPVDECIKALTNAGYEHLADNVSRTKVDVEKNHRICQETTPYRFRCK